jgi:thioredoxin-like negative regulator of GroEL
VGVTYNAFVKNAKTPVLINFYAPWCNVSSTFEPEYTALAKAFWGQVSFASIDASENEVEDVYVPYFPQLKLYRNNQYVHYEGELEREAVAAFLNRKLGTSVEVKKHDDL